jgi:putative glutamine amidotransferase
LIVSALDDEGVIEAVEADPDILPGGWVVAVQWHPEQTLEDLRLFAGLVVAARKHAVEARPALIASARVE